MSTSPSPNRVVTVLCAAEIASMAATMVYPALLPTLQAEWRLNNSGAGLIGGSFFGGYMAAVPLLTALTDRIDARRIYALACALAIVGAVGFGGLAQGLWTGVAFQFISGAGLAGTYMPGLKILSDHVEGPRQSRFIAFYTSTFGLGTSASLVLAGWVSAEYGWRTAFIALAIGPLVAAAAVLWLLPARTPRRRRHTSLAIGFRAVGRRPDVMAYAIGYAAHCWELFGVRSWMVAFLAFSASLQGSDNAIWGAAAAAAAINLLGPFASVYGNELAASGDRKRVIRRIMLASIAAALVVGFTASLPWVAVFLLLSVHFLLVMGDSAALTAGLIGAAPQRRRGAAMALHSFVGFGAGFIAPLVFGIMLDIGGGATNVIAWGLAFASLGIGAAIGPWALARQQPPRVRHNKRPAAIPTTNHER